MKILYINTTDIRGGAAISASRLERGLTDLFQTENRFLVRTKYSKNAEVLETRKKGFESGVEKITNICFNIAGLQYMWLPFSPKRILAFAKKFQPDIIHLHNPTGGYFRISDLPSLSRIAPIVWTFHDMWAFTANSAHTFGNESWKSMRTEFSLNKIYPWILFPSGNWLLRRKKRIYEQTNVTVVTPSDWLNNLAIQSPLLKGKRIERIRHGLDLDVFAYKYGRKRTRERLKIKEQDFVIMFSAENLKNNPWKGGRDLTRILRSIDNRIGEGEIRAILLGNQSFPDKDTFSHIRVVQPGYVSDERAIAEYYSAADVFLYPTRADTSPLVLIESIACGTPCVTFSIGGCPEIIRNGICGYSIEPFDISEFASKVLELMKDRKKTRELSLQSRKYAEDHFSIEKMARSYFELFQEVKKK